MGRGGSLEERLHDWLVRLLVERSHNLLCSVDVGTRYAPSLGLDGRLGLLRISDFGEVRDCRVGDLGGEGRRPRPNRQRFGALRACHS